MKRQYRGIEKGGFDLSFTLYLYEILFQLIQ